MVGARSGQTGVKAFKALVIAPDAGPTEPEVMISPFFFSLSSLLA
jgi:hypothetical protein